MGTNFYGKNEDQIASAAGPLVPAVISTSTEMQSSTLPNGNQILQSIPLTETSHRLRSNLINLIASLKADWGTQKSAVKNEIASAKEYLQDNIFTDIYENRELLVPSSILSLGAFLSGRVLTNKHNWGKSSVLLTPRVSVIGRLFTSLPSRICLPFILAGAIFHQVTPVSSENLWTRVEKDVLPEKLVDTYHSIRTEYLKNGLLKRNNELCDAVDNYLQSNIRLLRETVGKRFKS